MVNHLLLLEVIVGMIKAVPCVVPCVEAPFGEAPSETRAGLEMSRPKVHVSEVFRVLIMEVGVRVLVVEGFELFGGPCLLVRPGHDGRELSVLAVQYSGVSWGGEC